MQRSWVWKRSPHFGVLYGLPRGVLPIDFRCRVITPSALTFNYLDEKTESLDCLTDPQSPALYSNVVLKDSVADKKRGSLEAQWNRTPLELYPKDLPADDEPVKGSRQRRATRLKTKEAEEKAIASQDETTVEETDPEAMEQRTLTELENVIMTRDLEKQRLGMQNGFRSLPLLTREQEIILGTLIQRSTPILKMRRALRNKQKKKPTNKALAKACDLPLEEMEQILKDAHRAKNLMMQYNIKLVYHVAKLHKDRCPRENIGDLVMEGMGPRGLERAVMGFDPTRGHRFSTYGITWIRQVMSRCIDNDLTTIRVPQSAKIAVAKMKNAMHRLNMQYPTTPTEIATLAKEVELPIRKVRKYLRLTKKPLSLERTSIVSRKGEEVDSLAEQVADPNTVDAMETLRLQTIREMLDSAMSILDPRERRVLQLRYGLDAENGYEMTRGEVAKLFRLSNERVRQIEVKAKLRIRKVFKQTFLDAHLIDA